MVFSGSLSLIGWSTTALAPISQSHLAEIATPSPNKPMFDAVLDSTSITFTPGHQLSIAGAEHIVTVQLSPNEGKAYVLVLGYVNNVWSTLVRQWPEVLGGLAIGATLVYALLLSRIIRRRQTPGTPHCRRCNFDVSAQLSAPPATNEPDGPRPPPNCPECGINLSDHPPRRGRSTRRRLALPTALLLAVVVGYAGMHLAQLPRMGRASNWLRLYSLALDTYAQKHQISWLAKTRNQVSRIVIVDTRTGHERGTLCYPPMPAIDGMRLSPDGRHLAYADDSGTVSWISVRTGRTMAATPSNQYPYNVNPHITGFSGPLDDPWVYYPALDVGTKLAQLVRWKPSSGERQIVIEEPAYDQAAVPGSPFSGPQPRRYALFHWPDAPADPPATMSAPSDAQAQAEKSCQVTVRDPSGQITRIAPLSVVYSHSPPLLPSADGCCVYWTMPGLVCAIDLRIVKQRPLIARSSLVCYGGGIVSDDRSLLFLPLETGKILVCDLKTENWFATLKLPTPYKFVRLSVSSDNRCLMAVARSAPKTAANGATLATYPPDLFLFDLNPLSRALTDAPTPTPASAR